jgi:hypothetical protein
LALKAASSPVSSRVISSSERSAHPAIAANVPGTALRSPLAGSTGSCNLAGRTVRGSGCGPPRTQSVPGQSSGSSGNHASARRRREVPAPLGVPPAGRVHLPVACHHQAELEQALEVDGGG